MSNKINMNTLRKIVTVFIFIHLSGYMHAQKICPDESVKVDKKKIKQCKKTVDKINFMQLKCDTVLHNDALFKAIYFDEQGQLRKYFLKRTVTDGAHDNVTMCAYYNDKGSLVYFSFNGSDNCEVHSEYYYVHNGQILDFMCWADYSCEELGNKKDTRPVVGSLLIRTVEWDWTLTNFIRSNTLLEILKSNKCGAYGEFSYIK